jgi:regulatory protein
LKHEATLRERALRLLARREYSRRELQGRLAPHAASEEELAALLDALAGRGQLSDARYAEARVHALSRKYGAARIVHELKSKGVDPGVAEQAAAAARESDLERARSAWRRKFKLPPATREDRARQARFLQSRGFSFDVIKTVLDTNPEEET